MKKKKCIAILGIVAGLVSCFLYKVHRGLEEERYCEPFDEDWDDFDDDLDLDTVYNYFKSENINPEKDEVTKQFASNWAFLYGGSDVAKGTYEQFLISHDVDMHELEVDETHWFFLMSNDFY